MSNQADHKLTIFKSLCMKTLEEEKSMRDEARERLAKTHGFDKDAKDSLIIGCRYCRKTLGDLLVEEMYFIEKFDFDCEKSNLDKELEGTLYAFADSGLWHGRRNGYKRLTETLKKPNPKMPPNWKGGWLRSDNLNFVLDSFRTDDIHVYYDTRDGNIRSEGVHHDGHNYHLFREFFPCQFNANDTRGNDYGGEMDEEAFEAILTCAISKGEWISVIKDYTKPIGHYVAEIFGWPTVTAEEEKTLCRI